MALVSPDSAGRPTRDRGSGNQAGESLRTPVPSVGPHRPAADPEREFVRAVWREGRITFTGNAVKGERLIESDGIAPVGDSHLDAEIALFDAAVARVCDPAAVG